MVLAAEYTCYNLLMPLFLTLAPKPQLGSQQPESGYFCNIVSESALFCRLATTVA